MRVLNKILSQVDAIDCPVFHLIFFIDHLAFHGLETVLNSALVLSDFGEDLRHIKYSESVVPLKPDAVQTAVDEKSEI